MSFAETSPPSFPWVNLQNLARAIAIYQLEIIRAQEVLSKDASTYSLLQDGHQGMLQLRKPSAEGFTEDALC